MDAFAHVIVDRKGDIDKVMAEVDKYFDYALVCKIARVIGWTTRTHDGETEESSLRLSIKELIQSTFPPDGPASDAVFIESGYMMIHNLGDSLLIAFSPEHYFTNNVLRQDVGKLQYSRGIMHNHLDILLKAIDNDADLKKRLKVATKFKGDIKDVGAKNIK